jgi:hypothetical protein
VFDFSFSHVSSPRKLTIECFAKLTTTVSNRYSQRKNPTDLQEIVNEERFSGRPDIVMQGSISNDIMSAYSVACIRTERTKTIVFLTR